MMTPKNACPYCAAMRHHDWCRRNCSLSTDRAPEPVNADLDGSITLERAQEILRLNAMREPEGQKRQSKPVRVTAVDGNSLIYPSVAKAAAAASEKTAHHIRTTDVINVCAGRQKAACGFTFEYIALGVDG